MSNDREYSSERNVVFISSHFVDTSSRDSEEVIRGMMSPVSYRRYAEKFTKGYREVLSGGWVLNLR